MQATFEIADEDMALVEKLGETSHLSKDEILTRAIRQYATPKRYPLKGDAFGIWKDMTEDSVDYQRRIRGE